MSGFWESGERKGKNGLEKGGVTDYRLFPLLLSLLKEKYHHRQILKFSKAISFSEARLPEVLFRILMFVPITTNVQILSVLALHNEARLVKASVKSYPVFSNV